MSRYNTREDVSITNKTIIDKEPKILKEKEAELDNFVHQPPRGGRIGIRTPGGYSPQRFSRPPLSTAQPSFLIILNLFVTLCFSVVAICFNYCILILFILLFINYLLTYNKLNFYLCLIITNS